MKVDVHVKGFILATKIFMKIFMLYRIRLENIATTGQSPVREKLSYKVNIVNQFVVEDQG